MRRVWGLIFRESRFVLSVDITKRHPTSGTEMSGGADQPSMSELPSHWHTISILKYLFFKKRFKFFIVCMCVFWMWVSACKYGAPEGSKTVSDPLQLELL